MTFEPHTPIRHIKPAMKNAAFRARVVMLWRVPIVRNGSISYNFHILLSDAMACKGSGMQSMMHFGFGRIAPMVAYAGSKSSIENQLMGDFPTISIGLLKSVSKVVGFNPYPALLSKLVGVHYKFKVEVSKLSDSTHEMQYCILRVGDRSDIVNQITLEHVQMTPADVC
ncbi:hypothetical protein RIF29_00140 [Crotalaria pallida]|uniref:Uncharacterized protein n=1 Tax=Crotalaria pallida TaxID=3830 RepID=A0AAN9IVW6_CROPI